MTTNVVEMVERWSAGKATHEWLFATTTGTAMREGNWQRQVAWRAAKSAIGRPTLRVHDLRHTAASIWLGRGADPKVVQRILGHASATMTMDLYGHLIDANLWDSADRPTYLLDDRNVRGRSGCSVCRTGRASLASKGVRCHHVLYVDDRMAERGSHQRGVRAGEPSGRREMDGAPRWPDLVSGAGSRKGLRHHDRSRS